MSARTAVFNPVFDPRKGKAGYRQTGGGGSAPAAPSFTNAATFSAPEGADFDFTLAFSEACDVSITGGAQANSFQLSGTNSNVTTAPLRLFSQVYTGTSADAYAVTITIASHATGLTASQTLTATVTDVAAPVVNVSPVIGNTTGGAWEKSTLSVTPATWTGNVASVTRQWKRGGVDISGATGLTYIRDFSDLGQGTITCVETAVGQGGTSSPAPSNALAATISGIIFAFGIRSTDGGAVDTSRWSHLNSPEDVLSAGKNPTGDSITLYKGKSVGVGVNGGASPAMLAGSIPFTVGTNCAIGAVPTNTNVLVRFALGANGATQNQTFRLTTDDWSVSANTHIVASVDTATSVTNTQLMNVGAAGAVGGTGEIISGYSNWEANATYFPVLTTATGRISVGRGSGGIGTLRAFECVYPEYNINYLAANLPSRTAYSRIGTGNDGTGLGTTAAPFQHFVGDLGAGGVVPAFNVGADDFNLLGPGTYRPSTYTGRGGRLLLDNAGGTSGHQATIGSEPGASVIIDGSVIFTGAVAVTSSDTGGAWENPNHANLKKKTGLPALVASAGLTILDGPDRMFLAQFPSPSNPADINMSYPGNDGFIALTPSDFAGGSPVVHEDANNTCDINGTPGAGGYHKAYYTHPQVAARYSADNINLSGGVTQVIIHVTGNRLGPAAISNHNPATGYFEVILKDVGSGFALFHPSGSQVAYFAIRGHRYDIRTVGQYAFDGSGNLFMHPATSSFAYVSGDLNFGFKPANDYVTLAGTPSNPLVISGTGYLGCAIADPIVSSFAKRLGFNVRDVIVRQCMADIAYKSFVIQLSSTVFSQGTFKNVSINNCQDQAGVRADTLVAIDGLQIRDLDGTMFYTGTALPSPVTHKNFDICDQMGVHANGAAIYGVSANVGITQSLFLNIGIPFSTQGGNGAITRNNVFKNMWWMERSGYFDPSTSTQYDSPSFFSWQFDYGENGMLAEGILCVGDAVYGRSSGTNQPSTGAVIKNCVFREFYCTLNLTGITFQDCLFLCAGSNGPANTIRSASDITSKSGTDGGGNVFYNGVDTSVVGGVPVAAGSYVWTGGINADMQKVFTVNHGLGTYTARNIGHETTAFNHTGVGADIGKAMIIPAYGATFTLGDTWASTTTVRKLFRPGLEFAVLGNPAPDTTFSLPAGQGDNNKFQLVNGRVNMPTGTGGSAGTLNLVVDATCTNSHVSGGAPQTKRTTIPITVV